MTCNALLHSASATSHPYSKSESCAWYRPCIWPNDPRGNPDGREWSIRDAFGVQNHQGAPATFVHVLHDPQQMTDALGSALVLWRNAGS